MCKWGGPVRSWGCRGGGQDTGRARQAGSRWSVLPRVSPSPPAAVSPAQVPAPLDPGAARGGRPNGGVTAGCPAAPRATSTAARGGQLRPAGALPAAADGKQPSEQVNVRWCTRNRGAPGSDLPRGARPRPSEHLRGAGAARGQLNPSPAGQRRRALRGSALA